MFLRRKKSHWRERMRNAVSPRRGHARVLSYFILRLKRRPGTPEYIAKGFAVGVAINFWPVLFTHLVLGYIFCRIFRGDALAMFIGTLLGNPWTFAMVYPLCYKLGKTLMGLNPRHRPESIDTLDEVWNQIWPVKSLHNLTIAFHEIILPMTLGGFLLALPAAIAGYYLARNAVRVYQLQRRKVLTKKFHDSEHDIESPQI